MSHAMDHHDHRYTYSDYVRWQGDERWELIDGAPLLMSPAPSTRHQQISGRVSQQLFNQLEGKPCTPFYSPIDVRLPEGDEADDDVQTVVQPDVLVVCDPEKIDKKGVRGAPDFIVEILSPSTQVRDEVQKAALYEKYGVREYWIIDPDKNQVLIHVLGETGKWERVYTQDGKGVLEVRAVEGLSINLDRVMG